MPMRSTFEISTQIILLKIDGFLKGWILNITPLNSFVLDFYEKRFFNKQYLLDLCSDIVKEMDISHSSEAITKIATLY